MFKRILAIFLFSSLWMILQPELLTASNPIVVTGLNNAGIVETVIPEPEPEPIIEPAPVYYAPVAYVPQVANYTVTAKTAAFVAEPSYSDIYMTRKLIYAHNSSGLMGNLVNRYVGEIFTITEGGITRNYRVMDIRIYTLTDAYTLSFAGVGYKMLDTAISGANGYDVALMTCYGAYNASLGTSGQRFFVYANAV
ncbi:hypothetical protein IKW73_02140 [Candidatus Saccharibacteria bacterium]|nr:hypothetical protein [Candidatus Saccharibacteria bacterium]